MKARVFNTVDWRKYLDNSDNPRIKTFLESRGNDVFNQICENINRANRNNQTKIVLLIHPNAGNVISISKNSCSRFWFGRFDITDLRFFLFRPIPIILKPSAAKTLEKLAPSPRLAPVIKTVLD